MSKELWKPGNMLYPVPAVMVSCGTMDAPNIITVAWAGTVCSSPAMVSISVKPCRFSHHLIKESGEFVINLVPENLVYACDYCGVRSGKDVDKFKEMKLTASASRTVSCPGIAESPVNLECKVKQVITLGTHDLFLAEITGVVVDDTYMDEKGRFHLNDAHLSVYSHGTYFGLGKALGTFGYSVAKNKKKAAGGSDTGGQTKGEGILTAVKKEGNADRTGASGKRQITGNADRTGASGKRQITGNADRTGASGKRQITGNADRTGASGKRQTNGNADKKDKSQIKNSKRNLGLTQKHKRRKKNQSAK